MNLSTQPISLPAEVLRIGEAIAASGGRPVLVGGSVRDGLLGHPHSKDFDLEVFGLAIGRLRKVLTRFGPVHAVGRHFGVLKLTTREAEYDVSVPRRESKVGKGHKGFLVEADPDMTFDQAAARRDFTINAMGYALLDGDLLDPFNGVADLQARLLRHVGPAFGEDPLRVMRAMQFAGRFNLQIAPETLEICRRQNLNELPRERMWEEIRKLLLRAPAPSHGLRFAEPLGILPYFPELAGLYAAQGESTGEPGAWKITLAVVDAAARLCQGDEAARLELMLAALCHLMGRPPRHLPSQPGLPESEPAGSAGRALDGREQAAADFEPAVRSFLARLTNEVALVEKVVALVREYGQVAALFARRDGESGSETGSETDAAMRRLALRVSLPALERLARACTQGGREGAGEGDGFPAGDWLLEAAERLRVLAGPPEPMLKGRHLRDMGMASGPAMGRILKQAFKLQLDGRLTNLAEAKEWAEGRLEQETD